MSISETFRSTIRFVSGDSALMPPAWLHDMFGIGDACAHDLGAVLTSARIVDAITLDAAEFERQTIHAYRSIRQQLSGMRPVRFWNHIPAIHAVMDAQRDRYMVFNAGRFKAFEDWYGSSETFSRDVATASGVGHRQRDLVIHCLATREPGIAVENPRQVSSYRYSRHYGPLPPCFARATVVDAPTRGRVLLVGGTASIRGEESVYADSLAMQLDETFDNLASLIGAALRRETNSVDALKRFRFLRVYYPNETDVPAIVEALAGAMPALRQVEMAQAELCRPELLVEIEGIAEL